VQYAQILPLKFVQNYLLTLSRNYGTINIERRGKTMNNKDKFEQKLINRYKELKQREKTTLSLTIGGMYRDEMRKIEKLYLKNFKKSIDKSI
jgi:hypothetical protein